MKPDLEILLIADKGLTVIFILLICLANGVLIARQVRKPMFYQSVKLMTIVSLAIGDIILAMFPLLVSARLLFESDLSFATCRLLTSVTTYKTYLIHFVYGLGLVVLAAEVFFRNRFHTQWNETLTAVAVSSVPWILGLVIILPLCMSKVDYEFSCINSQSLESMFGVSVFLPVSLSIVVSIILNCVHFPTSQGQVISTSQQPIVISQQNVNQQGINLTQYPQSYAPGNGYYYPQNYNPYPQDAPSHPYPASQQVMNQSSTVNINLNQSANTVSVVSMNQRAEAQRLLIMSIIFGVMVVPFAAITLRASLIVWPNLLALTIVTQLVTWLIVARSFLTPLIMIRFSNL